jgi:hypothetical protein
MWLGEWKEIAASLPPLLFEVRQRGDFFAETYLRTRLEWLVALADDDPARARTTVDDAIGRWSSTGLHLQHFQYMLARVEIGLYNGDVAAAWAEHRRSRPAFERSMLAKAQIVDIEVHHMRARAGLALRAAGESDAPSATSVLSDVAAIERHGATWGNALAVALRACVSSLGNDRGATAALLQRAEDALRDAGMHMCATAARRRRGELANDASLVRAADERMTARGVARPDRIAAMLMPGRW